MKRLLITALLLAGVVASARAGAEKRDGWVSLFNGRNLKGWTKLNGEAKYRVEDGAIVGVSTLGAPNTFLATKERYGDFILELEYKVDEGVNSGIQFRSRSRPDYQEGRVYGYQYEIDPASATGNAGIYDEARRGWLYSLENEPEARKAFRHDDWNKVRIEAVGNSIRVWLNGIPTVDILDDADSEGFIALQVHSIGDNKALEGKSVRWRDIRIKTADLQNDLTPESRAIEQKNYVANTISPREAEQGWQLLWNGRDLEGWRSLGRGDMAKGWKTDGGELVITPKSGAGDIVTEKMYADFELSIDFKMGPNGNRRLGSLYDLIPAEGWKLTDKRGWNTARIVVRGNRVEHWLNGKKILEYERGNQMWNTIVSHILLQDHNDEVHYRNLKIREL